MFKVGDIVKCVRVQLKPDGWKMRAIHLGEKYKVISTLPIDNLIEIKYWLFQKNNPFCQFKCSSFIIWITSNQQ
jgi:hypothetical protein